MALAHLARDVARIVEPIRVKPASDVTNAGPTATDVGSVWAAGHSSAPRRLVQTSSSDVSSNLCGVPNPFGEVCLEPLLSHAWRT